MANINKAGGKAVGLSGKDGGLICAAKMEFGRHSAELEAPEILDLGHVGEVKSINPAVLEALEKDRFIPVIAPIGYDKSGDTSYNINADLVAAAVAKAVGAAKLVLLTDVPGVLDMEGRLCSQLQPSQARQAIADGTINGGMVPKVECCLEAVAHGVAHAHIIDGRIPHALLLEIFTDEGIGTVFVSE